MTEPTCLLSLVPATDILTASADFLRRGGVFMVPLCLCSVAALTAIFYKVLSLSRRSVVPASLAQKVSDFERLTIEQKGVFHQEIQQGKSALARLASVVLRHEGEPKPDIVFAVEAASREETSRLHAGIGMLDIVITVAPLLGLLGTASGLVTIFKGLGETADHLAIARGIAEALNTTIFGLAIAVPCVVAHGWLTRRIEVLTVKLEALLAHLAHACQKPA